VGYGAAELYTPIKSQILTFIPVKDSTGHNVLNAFNNFINQNGGYAVIGLPTTELYTPADQPGVIRQCFVHLCLDFYPTALEAPVRPVALGEEYISQYAYKFIDEIPNITADESTTPRSSGLFSIYVWENYSAVNSSTPQTISAMVFSHGVPQPRQILNLYITLPDGSLQLYTMPATNNNGRTGLTILPIAGENGEMIQYQVCLDIQGQESICIKDSYMIWGNP
jgi:hypothetical protein